MWVPSRARFPAAVVIAAVGLLLPSVVSAGGPAPAVTGAPVVGRWTTLIAAPAVRRPTGIAIDRRGNPKTAKWGYVFDAATQRIVKFGTNGKVLSSWSYGPTTRQGPAALAVGGAGSVFLADPISGAISKYSPAGKLLARWTGFSRPSAIVVAPNGYIYVAETGAHSVTEVSPAGVVRMRWDVEAGFLQEYTVPPGNSGNLGTPIALAWDPGDSLYVGTRCRVTVMCHYSNGLPTLPDFLDALLNFRVLGHFRGYLGDWWFGLGHAANGTPQEVPGKESEPFVTIDALASDPGGRAYVAGIIFQRGGSPQRAVIGYGPLGFKWGYWPLPSQAPVQGIAVDGNSGIYVSQAGRVIKLQRH